MQKALATLRHGQIEFDSGVDWPEGTRVEVFPLSIESVGTNETDWPTTPEGIAALLRRLDEREPLEMSDAEYAAWEAEHRTQRERQTEFTRQSWTQSEAIQP